MLAPFCLWRCVGTAPQRWREEAGPGIKSGGTWGYLKCAPSLPDQRVRQIHCQSIGIGHGLRPHHDFADLILMRAAGVGIL